MRSMPSRMITASSYANAGSYTRQFGTTDASTGCGRRVLETFTLERGAPRGGAEQEAAAALVTEAPDQVADRWNPNIE